MSEKRKSSRLAEKKEKSPTKKSKGEDKEKEKEKEKVEAIETEKEAEKTGAAPAEGTSTTTPAETTPSPKGKGRGRGAKRKEKSESSPRPLKRQNTMEITAAEGEEFIRNLNAQSLAKIHKAAAELRLAHRKEKEKEPEKEKEKEPEEEKGKGKKGKGKKKADPKTTPKRGKKPVRGISPVPVPKTAAEHRSGRTLDADKNAEEKKAKVMASFMPAAGVTASTKIEVVFSFDTTGSMSSILAEVRKNIEETVTRLLADIPNIRIGIIAHGDYCDASTSYVIKTLDLSGDADNICKFVRSVGSTGGGDADECYELVLHDSQALSWSADALKALVMIGDASPHGINYPQNTLKLDWREEAQKLSKSNIKVYSVQALGGWGSTSFWKEVAELTNGSFLTLAEFSLITDMFMGVCYREASEAHLAAHPEALEELNEDEIRIQMPEEVTKSGITEEQLIQIHNAIHGGYSNVVVHGTTYLISIGNSGCRFVRIGDTTFIEQNKEKSSRYARYAWEGRKITWVINKGKWGLVMDGVIVKHDKE